MRRRRPLRDEIDFTEAMIRPRIEGRPRQKPPVAVGVVEVEGTVGPIRTEQEQREYGEPNARCDKRGGPFELGFEAARGRLSYMQHLYRHGGFMGHREDLMEDIELEERHIKRLEAEKLTEAFWGNRKARSFFTRTGAFRVVRCLDTSARARLSSPGRGPCP